MLRTSDKVITVALTCLPVVLFSGCTRRLRPSGKNGARPPHPLVLFYNEAYLAFLPDPLFLITERGAHGLCPLSVLLCGFPYMATG